MDEKREPQEGNILTEAQLRSRRPPAFDRHRARRARALVRRGHFQGAGRAEPAVMIEAVVIENAWKMGPTCKHSRTAPRLTRDAVVAAICGLVVVLMVGASYAAVPFYDWFCRATGFNGTTQVATAGPSGMTDRKVTVRFDANVGPGLPWRFEPEQNSIEVRLGEVVTVNYRVINQAARPITAQAAYNVAPLNVGSYFQKINCFCFTEQTMAPGEKREMPVVFYVDPALVGDHPVGAGTVSLFVGGREKDDVAIERHEVAGASSLSDVGRRRAEARRPPVRLVACPHRSRGGRTGPLHRCGARGRR